jgi:protease II
MSAHEQVRPQSRSQGHVSPLSEPRAEQQPLVRNLHGTRLTDEFAWLKASNWREVMRDPQQLDPAIRAYLQAENDYCEHALADNTALKEALFAEMKGRIKEDDTTVPDPDGPYAYYVRYRKDGQHPLLCREPRHGGAEQLLLDGDALARGKPFFRLGAVGTNFTDSERSFDECPGPGHEIVSRPVTCPPSADAALLMYVMGDPN